MVEASESTNFGTAPCKPGAGAAPPSPGTSEHPIPAGGFFHERMHPEDPNYHLIRQLELTTWAEWGWQLDGNFSRHATVAEYIESAAKMLERSFDVLISFRDQAPVSTKCAGLEKFKEVALQTIRATLTSQSQTWGGDIANSAIREFAEKAQTLFDAAKRKLVDSELLKRSEPSSVSESLAVPSEPTGIE